MVRQTPWSRLPRSRSSSVESASGASNDRWSATPRWWVPIALPGLRKVPLQVAKIPRHMFLDPTWQGDQDAFQQLAEPYRRQLQVHCYRMLGSLHEAEDLVQDTFLRAWRARERYEGRTSFRNCLYLIA